MSETTGGTRRDFMKTTSTAALGAAVVGFAKGSQTVRKLLQRNRSAVLPYLPPEVHRGDRFGRSADVYMFGILM